MTGTVSRGAGQSASGDDVGRLREFVLQLKAILEGVVEHPQGLLPEKHHLSVRLAWQEVQPSFQDLIKAIDSDAKRLPEFGLTGHQLAFELSLFARARADLVAHAPMLFIPPHQKPRPGLIARLFGFGRRLRGLLGSCLKVGDVILGSLGALFPPGEVIKQFKEGIEEGVKLGLETRSL